MNEAGYEVNEPRPDYCRAWSFYHWMQSQTFVVGPHTENFYGLFLFDDLIDQAVLSIDPPGVQAGEFAHQLFIGGRILKRIDPYNFYQRPGLNSRV